MPTCQLTKSTLIAGVSIAGLTSHSGSAVGHERKAASSNALPAAKAGSLTTRTDADTGVVTLSTGHGITTGMKVDVYFPAGVRYHMTATVATNAVTVDGGFGTDLPLEDTAVYLAEQVVINTDFDADAVTLMAISATRRTHIEFRDDSDATIADSGIDIAAGGMWDWAAGGGAIPTAGNIVGSICVSCGESAGASDLGIGILYTA